VSARLILTCLLGLAGSALAAVASDPFTGQPIQVNAVTVFEAENFDKGGEGVAFHDPHSCGQPPGDARCTCSPGAYRPDGVNVCSSNPVGGFHVSYIDAGSWMQYMLWVPKEAAGLYVVELRVAFADITCCSAAAYHAEVDSMTVTDSTPLGPAVMPNWTAFEWRGKSGIFLLGPGIHDLRIVVDKPWFNLDAVRLTRVYP
jgi:hypothetical protein